MVNALVDYLNAPGVVPLQRVVDNFDGDTLNERWTQRDVQGTGTFAMNDSVDGGYSITTSTSTNDQSRIDFNGIDHYDPTTGCIHISTFRLSSVNSASLPIWGLTSDTGFTEWVANRWSVGADATNFILTINDTASTDVSTGIAVNTNWNDWKISIGSTAAKSWYNGDLVAIATTAANLPDVPLEPVFRIRTTNGDAFTINFRYCEVYNT